MTTTRHPDAPNPSPDLIARANVQNAQLLADQPATQPPDPSADPPRRPRPKPSLSSATARQAEQAEDAEQLAHRRAQEADARLTDLQARLEDGDASITLTMLEEARATAVFERSRAVGASRLAHRARESDIRTKATALHNRLVRESTTRLIDLHEATSAFLASAVALLDSAATHNDIIENVRTEYRDLEQAWNRTAPTDGDTPPSLPPELAAFSRGGMWGNLTGGHFAEPIDPFDLTMAATGRAFLTQHGSSLSALRTDKRSLVRTLTNPPLPGLLDRLATRTVQVLEAHKVKPAQTTKPTAAPSQESTP